MPKSILKAHILSLHNFSCFRFYEDLIKPKKRFLGILTDIPTCILPIVQNFYHNRLYV